jgi:hypothetical protein
MSLAKKILIALVIILVAIQFIRPARSNNNQTTATDISKVAVFPDSVRVIIQNACYDCHSNNTVYPWYSNIQPVGWLLAGHIREGRNNLNFSEFGEYSRVKQLSKLDAIATVLGDDIMPLPSYKLMHKNARLSTDEKTLLINWTKQATDSLSVK